MGNRNLVDYVISIGATYNLQIDFPLFSTVNLNKVVGATKKEENTDMWDFVVIARTRKGKESELDHLSLQHPRITASQALTVIGKRAGETAKPYFSQGVNTARLVWGIIKKMVSYYR